MAAIQPVPDAIRFKVPESDRDSMTPEEYAVEFLDRDDKPYLGGCIVYGRYPGRERWMPNCSARWLVRHLIETWRKSFEAGRDRGREDAAEVISGLQAELILESQRADQNEIDAKCYRAAEEIRKTAEQLQEAGEGPYGSDEARRLRQLLGAMDADPGFAALLNAAYIRGVADAAKVAEGRLLDDE